MYVYVRVSAGDKPNYRYRASILRQTIIGYNLTIPVSRPA